MATLPKIELDKGIVSRLPKDSLIRAMAEGRDTDFSDRVNAVAKAKIEARINGAEKGLSEKGLLGAFSR